MYAIKKVLLFSFLAWFFGFITNFILLSLKESNRILYESVISLVITAFACFFSYFYLSRAKKRHIIEGILFGMCLFIYNIILDLPLYLIAGPVKTNLVGYLADTGIMYLIYPMVSLAVALGIRYKPSAKQLDIPVQETNDKTGVTPENKIKETNT